MRFLWCFSDFAQAGSEGHGGVGLPFGATVGMAAEVAEVVHVGIGLHLEGVEQVAGVLEMPPVGQRTEPVEEVLPVEAEPGVVGGASLIEVYHLVVLHGIVACIEGVGLVGGVGDDVSEEGQSVVALANPEGQGDGFHVVGAAWSYGMQHERYDGKESVSHC